MRIQEKRKGSKSYAHRIVEVYIRPEEKEMLGLVFPMTKDQAILNREWNEDGRKGLAKIKGRQRCRFRDRRRPAFI